MPPKNASGRPKLRTLGRAARHNSGSESYLRTPRTRSHLLEPIGERERQEVDPLLLPRQRYLELAELRPRVEGGARARLG